MELMLVDVATAKLKAKLMIRSDSITRFQMCRLFSPRQERASRMTARLMSTCKIPVTAMYAIGGLKIVLASSRSLKRLGLSCLPRNWPMTAQSIL
jgi:hypothetical protein